PVEQVDSLSFGIVVTGDLLLEQRYQERLQIEIAWQESKLLEDDFRPLEALGILVLLHVLLDECLHFAALAKPPLLLFFDGLLGFAAGEFEDFIDRLEKLLGLLRGA